MTPTLILLTSLLAATTSPPQSAAAEKIELLKTFRAEFITLTPGRGKFPGKFVMGNAAGPASEQPPREVTMANDFAIARYEVPQNLWQAVMGANPSRWKGPRNSVEMVSYDDCVEFCRRVTTALRQAGLIDQNQVVRLPSEAEWEYAARAGTTTRFSFGDDAAALGDYAWFHGNAAGNDPPVGAKRPNPWGLYDVYGYLWEWCADPGHPDYQGAPANAAVWTAGGDDALRAVRGGSWKTTPPHLHSATRSGTLRLAKPRAGKQQWEFVGGLPRDLKDDAVGLRCVLARQAD